MRRSPQSARLGQRVSRRSPSQWTAFCPNGAPGHAVTLVRKREWVCWQRSGERPRRPHAHVFLPSLVPWLLVIMSSKYFPATWKLRPKAWKEQLPHSWQMQHNNSSQLLQWVKLAWTLQFSRCLVIITAAATSELYWIDVTSLLQLQFMTKNCWQIYANLNVFSLWL